MIVDDKPRTDFLGASDLGSAFGFDMYRPGHELWMRKTGRLGDVKDTKEMRRGRQLEPIVRDEELPLKDGIISVWPPEEGKMIVHPEFPHIGCHPDGSLTMEGQMGTGSLEIKSVNSFVYAQIKEDGLPRPHVLQLNQTMGLAGLPWGLFAVHNADSWETLIFPMEFDQDVFAWCVRNANKWWSDHILADVCPPDLFDTTPDPTLPVLKGEAVTRSDEAWSELVDEFHDYDRLKKQLELLFEGPKDEETKKRSGGLKDRIIAAVHETGYKTVKDDLGRKVVLVQSKGRQSFDPELVAQAGPLDLEKVMEWLSSDQVEVAFVGDKGMYNPPIDEIRDHMAKFCRLDPTDDRFKKRGDAYEFPRLYVPKDLDL